MVEDVESIPVSGRHLLALIGPTAVGKTAVSLMLARRFAGEIVSADSRLFYQGMDVGTAKPTLAERDEVRHHLVDITKPEEPLSLAGYQELAYATIDAVQSRDRLPILVGGTGQYVWAVVEGWGIPRVSPRPALRAALFALGQEELSRWLRCLDPQASARTDSRNVRRVVRALEVTLVSGRPISQLQEKKPPPFSTVIVGLTCERRQLYARIDRRVDQMMAAGLLEEVRALRDAGYSGRLPAMSSLGYRQLWRYLDGKCSLEEAVERIKFETHRFARQQYTWFRPDDPRIRWFDVKGAGVEHSIQGYVGSRLGL